MDSETNARVRGAWNVARAEPRRASAKHAYTFVQTALILALFSALSLSASPAQAQTETVIYSFNGYPDGAYPQSGLVSDAAGNFYGTTENGGVGYLTYGYGTVYELSPNVGGGWTENVLYRFTGGTDGAYPIGPLIVDSEGNLYGTTYQGGANGYGVVFELSPVGPNWTETVLYSFASGTDGANPENGLIMDPAGNLYGTTSHGGNGLGVVFELSPSPDGWTEQIIYSGAQGLTMDGAGNIFAVGGMTLFELSPNDSGGWTPTVIHTFYGGTKDGYGPDGTVALDKAGNIYGTTFYGGLQASGTIYKLTYSKKKGWTEKLLFSFKGGKGGLYPYAGVVLDPAGNLYGTTIGGFKTDAGTAYELALVGKAAYRIKILSYFTGANGSVPMGRLILNSAGNLYGTTSGGGNYRAGAVYQITP